MSVDSNVISGMKWWSLSWLGKCGKPYPISRLQISFEVWEPHSLICLSPHTTSTQIFWSPCVSHSVLPLTMSLATPAIRSVSSLGSIFYLGLKQFSSVLNSFLLSLLRPLKLDDKEPGSKSHVPGFYSSFQICLRGEIHAVIFLIWTEWSLCHSFPSLVTTLLYHLKRCHNFPFHTQFLKTFVFAHLWQI